MCRFLAVLAVVVCCAGAQTPKLPVGMNLPGQAYWDPSFAFIDLMKGASDWSPQEPAAFFDTDGYPLEITNGNRHEVALPVYGDPGRYVLLYDGVGTFSYFGSISPVSGGGSPGRILLNYRGDGQLAFVRIETSQRANHVRNMRIIPESLENQDYTTNPFRPQYLKALENFHCLRMMGEMSINSSTATYWRDRSTPRYYTQHWFEGYHEQDDPVRRGKARGTCIEHQIRLCNILGADGWFCVPHQVDDEYIRRFAEMVRDSLHPGLKAYIEYSNELWNFYGAAYNQSHWVSNNAPGAADSIQQALAAIGPAGHPSAWVQKDGWMQKRVFDIWRSVFAGADRSRLVCVGTGQLCCVNGVVDWIMAHGGCDATSGAPYPRNIDDYRSGDCQRGIRLGGSLYQQYGIPYLCYEGGLESDPGGEAYARSQAVYDLYMEMFRDLVDNHGVLFVALSFVGQPHSFGHVDSLAQAALPREQWPMKWRALMDGNAEKVRVGVRHVSPHRGYTVVQRASAHGWPGWALLTLSGRSLSPESPRPWAVIQPPASGVCILGSGVSILRVR